MTNSTMATVLVAALVLPAFATALVWDDLPDLFGLPAASGVPDDEALFAGLASPDLDVRRDAILAGPWWDTHLELYDLDGDKIDDQLQTGSMDSQHVYVTFDHWPTDADRVLLDNLGAEVMFTFQWLPTVHVLATPSAMAAVAALDDVRLLEYVPTLTLQADVAGQALQVAEEAGSAGVYAGDTLQSLGYTGEGMVVAVLDTGVTNAHPAFEDRWITGTDVAYMTSVPCVDPVDDQGHGSHVAGSVLGNEPGAGYKGTAPDAKLVEIKISVTAGITALSIGGGDRGYDWVLDYNNQLDQGLAICPGVTLDDRIDVATMSFGAAGGATAPASTEALYDQLVASGVVVTTAAGNDGNGEYTVGSPSVARSTISVANSNDKNTASRGDDSLAGSSSRGPNPGRTAMPGNERFMKPEIGAPGTNIMSVNFLYPTSPVAPKYVSMTGTSMATPELAGLVALLLQAGEETSDQTGGVNLAAPTGPAYDGSNGYVQGRHNVLDALIFGADYMTGGVPAGQLAAHETTTNSGRMWNNGYGYGHANGFDSMCWLWANILMPGGAKPPSEVDGPCGLGGDVQLRPGSTFVTIDSPADQDQVEGTVAVTGTVGHFTALDDLPTPTGLGADPAGDGGVGGSAADIRTMAMADDAENAYFFIDFEDLSSWTDTFYTRVEFLADYATGEEYAIIVSVDGSQSASGIGIYLGQAGAGLRTSTSIGTAVVGNTLAFWVAKADIGLPQEGAKTTAIAWNTQEPTTSGAAVYDDATSAEYIFTTSTLGEGASTSSGERSDLRSATGISFEQLVPRPEGASASTQLESEILVACGTCAQGGAETSVSWWTAASGYDGAFFDLLGWADASFTLSTEWGSPADILFYDDANPAECSFGGGPIDDAKGNPMPKTGTVPSTATCAFVYLRGPAPGGAPGYVTNQHGYLDTVYLQLTTGGGLPTVPGAVGSLAASPGDSQVSLSWAIPSNDGNDPITGYNVYQDTALIASPSGTSHTVTGLTNDQSYTFEVAAVNGIGEGTLSPVVATPTSGGGGGGGGVELSFSSPAQGSTVEPDVDFNGAMYVAPPATARVIVADIDSGFNPYHDFFYETGSRPGGVSDIYPAGSGPDSVTPALLNELGIDAAHQVTLTRTGNFAADYAADTAIWNAINAAPTDVWHFVGTNLLGSSHACGGVCILADDGDEHGVGTSAAILRANPDAIVYVLENSYTAAEQRAFVTEPWVDIVSTSYGPPGSPPCGEVIFQGGLCNSLQYSYEGVVGQGKLHFGASDNSPSPALQDSTAGPWWSIGITGFEHDTNGDARYDDASGDANGKQAASGSVADFAADFNQVLPYCVNCSEGLDDFVSGTSFATPRSAGVASKFLLDLRDEFSHNEGIVDGNMVAGWTNWDLRRALEEAAWYPGVGDYDPIDGVFAGAATPVPDEGAYTQLGWGVLDPSILDDARAVLAGGPALKSSDACDYMMQHHRNSYLYWSNVLATSDGYNPGATQSPDYIPCDQGLVTSPASDGPAYEHDPAAPDPSGDGLAPGSDIGNLWIDYDNGVTLQVNLALNEPAPASTIGFEAEYGVLFTTQTAYGGANDGADYALTAINDALDGWTFGMAIYSEGGSWVCAMADKDLSGSGFEDNVLTWNLKYSDLNEGPAADSGSGCTRSGAPPLVAGDMLTGLEGYSGHVIGIINFGGSFGDSSNTAATYVLGSNPGDGLVPPKECPVGFGVEVCFHLDGPDADFTDLVDKLAASNTGTGLWSYDTADLPNGDYTAMVEQFHDGVSVAVKTVDFTVSGNDEDPPLISNIAVVATHDEATVTWDTDEPADSVVHYAEGSGADPETGSTAGSATLTTTHSVVLTGLTQETTYTFHVHSSDAAGNEATSTPDMEFTTGAPDTDAPVISGLSVAPGADRATVSWTTDEPATSRIGWSDESGVGGFEWGEDLGLKTEHSMNIINLDPNTMYYFVVESADAAGNTVQTSESTFTTSLPEDQAFVQLWVDGSPDAIELVDVSSGPASYSVDLDTTVYANGLRLVEVVFYDGDGHENRAAILLDVLNPVQLDVEIVTWDGDTIVGDDVGAFETVGVIALGGTFDDLNGGLGNPAIELYVGGNLLGEGTFDADPDVKEWTFDFDPTGMDNGVYEMEARFVADGQTPANHLVSFEILNPSLIVETPGDGDTRYGTFAFSGTFAGIDAHVEAFMDADAPETVSNQDGSWSLAVLNPAEGAHTLTARLMRDTVVLDEQIITIDVQLPESCPLAVNEPVRVEIDGPLVGEAMAAVDEICFIVLPEAVSTMTISMVGADCLVPDIGCLPQDWDLYVQSDDIPAGDTAADACYSADFTTDESCTIANPDVTIWYVMIRAYQGAGAADITVSLPANELGDIDFDGHGEGDNCPTTFNPDQEDWNEDGEGDVCDDTDGDGHYDDVDAFPDNEDEWVDSDSDNVGDNSDICPGSDDNLDSDGDTIPDGCDDSDGDGVMDPDDQCPNGSDTADLDGDGIKDGCDSDVDGDGVSDAEDQFPRDPTAAGDADGDGVDRLNDQCRGHDDRQDADRDGIPDACDDSDGDGVPDSTDQCPGGDDSLDTDGDGLPDGCDLDDDDDGQPDTQDEFPTDPTKAGDSDKDGVDDLQDKCNGQDDTRDLDSDGVPDGCDTDRDGDGVRNGEDAYPDDPSRFEVPAPNLAADSDSDGVRDDADWYPNDPSRAGDHDGDGIDTLRDLCRGVADGGDMDFDGQPDGCDSDRDGDGVLNGRDAFPNDPNASSDHDGDGVPDADDVCEGSDVLDKDRDGIPDGCDEVDDRPEAQRSAPRPSGFSAAARQLGSCPECLAAEQVQNVPVPARATNDEPAEEGSPIAASIPSPFGLLVAGLVGLVVFLRRRR